MSDQPCSSELIDFETEIEYEELRDFPKNIRFKIPLWKPNQNGNCNEIVIMLNGFLEGVGGNKRKRDRWLKRYECIANRLCQANIASLLMPLPFHFDRCDDFGGEDVFAPVERLKEHGTYFYHGGYTQVVLDVNILMKSIQEDPSKYGIDNSDFKIHLLGYSLGGVVAIGVGLDAEVEFESLSLLLSTWNLSDIAPESIESAFREQYGFGADEWTKVLDELEIIREESPPVFRKLIWGDGDSVKFENCAKRVMFIHGLEDRIFPNAITQENNKALVESMQQEQKCTFINLPSDHVAVRRRETIAGYISTFISQG